MNMHTVQPDKLVNSRYNELSKCHVSVSVVCKENID